MPARSQREIHLAAYALPFGAAALALLFPYGLEINVRADVFRTLAEVGGALLGLVGVIGVFALTSFQTTLSDLNRDSFTLEQIKARIGNLGKDEERLKRFKDEAEEIKTRRIPKCRLGFFATISFLLVEIVFAFMGLGQVPFPDWRWPLSITFGSIFAVGYLIFLILSKLE
jgi:hypothetical protein